MIRDLMTDGKGYSSGDILIISRNAVVREGLGAIFRRQGWRVRTSGPVAPGRDVNKASLVILDADPRSITPNERARFMKTFQGRVPMMIYGAPNASGAAWKHRLTGFEMPREMLRLARKAGARVGETASGTVPDPRAAPDLLTDREYEVFRLIGEGRRNGEIAATLGISVKTVETHKEHLKQKLGVKSNADLLQAAIRNGAA